MDKDKIIMYAPDGELQDSVQASGVLDISDLSRKQTKLLAKTAAGWTGEDGTFSWQDVASGQADIQGKTPRQEKRFKRIFNKQLSENLSPILERQYKQELLNRMKSGDASAMSQWTTDGINKFGYQFMPVMLTAATLPFGIGGFGQAMNTIGLLPAIGVEAGSWGLGYGGYKLGSYLDDDFGTKWIAPAMSFAGGVGGYGLGYKGMVNAGSNGWLPKGGTFTYSDKFIDDVATNVFNKKLRTKLGLHLSEDPDNPWSPLYQYRQLVREKALQPTSSNYKVLDGYKHPTEISKRYPDAHFNLDGTLQLNGRKIFPGRGWGRKVYVDTRPGGGRYDFGPGNFKPNILVTQRKPGHDALQIKSGVMYPGPPKDPGKPGHIWWERDNLFYGNEMYPTFVIDDVIPTESAHELYRIGSDQSRVSGAVNLTDPKLNLRFIDIEPLTGFPVERKFDPTPLEPKFDPNAHIFDF